MIVCDTHCHFFSAGFFRTLSKELPTTQDQVAAAVDTLVETLGWLLDSAHLSERLKSHLKPAPEVLDARDRLRAAERARRSA